MPETMSVTEARDNFPSLVRQVAGRDEPVVVTSRNRPQVVIMRWETFQRQQNLQVEGARHRLQSLASQMEQLAASLREAYVPDSLDLSQGTQDLLILARQAWIVCRSLDKARRHLASTLTDGLLNLMDEGKLLTPEQLDQILAALLLLQQENLTNKDVAQADLALAQVGLDSVFPIGDELASQYKPIAEEAT
jgi:prevent-host-death family protein